MVINRPWQTQGLLYKKTFLLGIHYRDITLARFDAQSPEHRLPPMSEITQAILFAIWRP